MPAVPLLPDIHPLTDATYKPYDIGQVGQLDLHVLAKLFGGEGAARDLTPAWDGGIYWGRPAPQRKDCCRTGQHEVDFALLSLGLEGNAESAGAFARLYAESLGRKYSGLHKENTPPPADAPAGNH